MSGALGLLARRPSFAAFTGAIGLSFAGSGAATTALTLYVQETRGTGTAVAALLIAAMAPRLLGPLFGGVVDRVDQRRLLIACDLGQAALFAAMATLPPFGVILGLLVATTLLQTAWNPARTAAVPALVAEDELIEANALTGAAVNLYLAVGPLVGGLLFAASGSATLPLLVNVGTFLGSAALSRALPSLPPEAEGEPQGFLTSVRTGGAFVAGDRVTRTIVVSDCALLAFIGLDNVALVFLVRDTLGGSASAYGIADGVFGAGMLIGTLAISRRAPLSPAGLYILSIAISSLGALLVAIAPTVAFLVAVQLISGAGNGLENVASETLFHHHVPRRLLGRVSGFFNTATSAGLGLAMVAGGLIVDSTSPRFAFYVAAAGGVLVGLLAARPLLGTPTALGVDD